MAAPPDALAGDATNLKRIGPLHFLIEVIRPNDCGVNKDDLMTSLRFVVSQSRMKISDSHLTPTIYLNVNIFDDCSAANVRLEVYTFATIPENHVYGTVTIWDDEHLLGGRSDMSSRVANAVERLAKSLVVDWSSVNP